MSKKSRRHQNRGTPRGKETVQDNWAWANGYMPRPGIDTPVQSAGVHEWLQPIEAEEIYLKNSIAANIVDIPVGDLTRNGWTLQVDDSHVEVGNKIESRMGQLKVKKVMKQLFRYERLYGIGSVLIGTDETNITANEKLNEASVGKLKHLTVFSRKKMGNIDYNYDVLSENYGKTSFISVNGAQIDSSRLLIQQSLLFEDDIWGRSIFETIMNEMNASRSTLESVTQILYDYVFKVFKTPEADSMSQEEKLLIGTVANAKFHTDGMAIIRADEELKHETKTVTGIDQLLDYLWERLAAAARMPKSVIMGQETGTLTGAQYDLMNYYGRISDIQENELRPHLERIVRLLFREQGVDPDSVNWHIQFNPLYQVDGSTDAEIKYKQAQTDKIYLEAGVLTSEEVHDNRFGKFGLTNGSKLNADSADFDWEA